MDQSDSDVFQSAVGPSGAEWDPSVTHRLRVLLHTFPLHDLHLGDARRDPALRHYDALAIAMRVLALVIDQMGLDHEMDRSALLRALEPTLSAMDAAAGMEVDATRHEAILDRVLSGLRNDANRRRPFEIIYADHERGGDLVQRKLEFRLVIDHFHPSGGTVLRLSNEAINMFLNAFELDIEDAQAAAEAVVQSQLARGKFHEALQSARTARLQSIRYHEKISRILRDTRRDVTSLDWRATVPGILDDALTHIRTRLGVEESILAAARDRLDVLAEGDDRTQQVADVAGLVRDCRLRHTELQNPLMRARTVFLDEQARQRFVPPALQPRPDLFGEVIEPVLRMQSSIATTVVEDATPSFIGARPPEVFSLRDLVGWQLRPRRERTMGEVPMLELDLVGQTLDVTHYPPEIRAAAEAALRALDREHRLSQLLESVTAAGAPPAVAEAIALMAANHYAPEPGAEPLVRVGKREGEAFHVLHLYGDELTLSPPTEEDVDASLTG